MIRKCLFTLGILVIGFLTISLGYQPQETESVSENNYKGQKVIESSIYFEPNNLIQYDRPLDQPKSKQAERKAVETIKEEVSLVLPYPTPPSILNLKKPKIAVVIDDLGLSHRTQDVIDLPYDLTLAFLPDPDKSPNYAKQAAKKGHEILVHMPMEAMNFSKEEKSILKVSMSKKDIDTRLEQALKKFPDAIGINNHTGSKYTSDSEAIEKVLIYLKDREYLFLDSKTISSSKAKLMADKHGYDILERSVFIDHHKDTKKINAALAKTERWAKKNGYAIAIGHPYDETVSALGDWLPSLKSKGYELITLKELQAALLREQRSAQKLN